jgi:DNA-binding HxlR family transcriptional regulator
MVRACSIWRALDVLGDVPILLVLQAIWLGEFRFSDIQHRTNLPKALLSDRLQYMVSQGLIARQDVEGSAWSHYRLGAKGLGLLPVTLMLLRWESRWVSSYKQFTVEVVHTTCGAKTSPKPICSACGGDWSFESVDWNDGPGLSLMPPQYKRRRQARARARTINNDLLFTNSVAILGDRWACLVIRSVITGLTRFDEIRSDTAMASNILSERLRWLVETNMLHREVGDGGPYSLTDKSRDFFPVLSFLQDWGDRYCQSPEGPPVTLTHRACQGAQGAMLHCSSCCGALELNSMEVRIVEL